MELEKRLGYAVEFTESDIASFWPVWIKSETISVKEFVQETRISFDAITSKEFWFNSRHGIRPIIEKGKIVAVKLNLTKHAG